MGHGAPREAWGVDLHGQPALWTRTVKPFGFTKSLLSVCYSVQAAWWAASACRPMVAAHGRGQGPGGDCSRHWAEPGLQSGGCGKRRRHVGAAFTPVGDCYHRFDDVPEFMCRATTAVTVRLRVVVSGRWVGRARRPWSKRSGVASGAGGRQMVVIAQCGGWTSGAGAFRGRTWAGALDAPCASPDTTLARQLTVLVDPAGRLHPRDPGCGRGNDVAIDQHPVITAADAPSGQRRPR